jgi:hypothetical protein
LEDIEVHKLGVLALVKFHQYRKLPLIKQHAEAPKLQKSELIAKTLFEEVLYIFLGTILFELLLQSHNEDFFYVHPVFVVTAVSFYTFGSLLLI